MVRRLLLSVFGAILLGSALLGEPSPAGSVDLSVITNETRLSFKVVLVGNMERKESSYLTRKAEALVRKDLLETGYFEILTPPPPIASALDREPFDAVSARSVSSLGAEGVVGMQFALAADGVTLHGVVRDPLNGAILFDKIYRTPGKYSELVHRFVDDILFQFAGIRGVATSRIAFVGKTRRGYDLFTMDFDGENTRRMTFDHVLAFNPAWSHDKRHIFYVTYLHGDPQIIDYDLSTGSRHMLFAYPGLNITPTFSPDGKKLAVALSRGRASQHTQIYLYTFATKRLVRLTYSSSNSLSPTFAPSGNALAFVSDRDGHPQIFVMDADGSNLHRLTFDGSYNVAPAWSPRGDWIAYVCMNDLHRPKICLISPDGSSRVMITRGAGRDDSPSWSPDGRFLLYIRQIRGHSTLAKVWIDGHGREFPGHYRRSVLTPSWSGP
ncbi:MAG: DPP IV N-terminal domain-containing protein [Leptospirales bacterium]